MRELFQLPDIQEQKQHAKRAAAIPDISMFTDQQKGVHDGLLDWLDKDGGGMALLQGYAGTGKTYCLSRILEQYLHDKWGNRVASTATTNKAVKVAYTMSEYFHHNLEYSTIHSLLALREVILPDGSIDFKPDYNKKPSIAYCKLVLLDEVSMLQKSLFGYLQPYINMGLKVIFVGDNLQIPPIGQRLSMPFEADVQKRYNIKVFALTDIVRQAKNSPIITFTQHIRENINSSISFSSYFKHKDIEHGGSGVYFIRRSDKYQRDYFDALLRHCFTSPNFNSNPDFSKVIVWRNDVAHVINRGVRKMIYGKGKLRRIEPGEKLITNEPVFAEDGFVDISNSEELEVISFEKHSESVNRGQFYLTFYQTEVRYRDIQGNPVVKSIPILSDLGQIEYDKICDLLIANAKMHTMGSLPATTAWREYYNFKRKFANVGYNYGLTSHKSQGSSYSNALIMSSDITCNPKVLERNKILYTASSRPTTRLFLI